VTRADLLMGVLELHGTAMFTVEYPELARPDDVIDGDVEDHRELADDLRAIARYLLADGQGAYVALRAELENGGAA
jgi:hypothetical protein